MESAAFVIKIIYRPLDEQKAPKSSFPHGFHGGLIPVCRRLKSSHLAKSRIWQVVTEQQVYLALFGV
jgi:hypothetical protein